MLIDIKSDILQSFLKELIEDDFIRFNLLTEHLNALENQINDFLERSNHEIVKDRKGQSLIMVKSAEATEAANIISDTDETVALKLLEYNHFSNEGNVDSKRSILIDLGRYFEPKREELKRHFESEIFKGGDNPIVISRLFDMVNNLQIRHQNDKQHISLEDKEQLEKWYDATYNTFLFIIISAEQLHINQEYNKLKHSVRK